MECRIRTGLFLRLRQQRPHIRLGALMVYLLAALIQLGNYQGFGTDTVLEGQWFTTVVVLLGGAAIYLLWYFSRREGSAQWGKIRSDGRVVCRLAVHLYFAFALLGRPRQHCRAFRFGGGVGILSAQTRAECVYHFYFGQCIVRPVVAKQHHL